LTKVDPTATAPPAAQEFWRQMNETIETGLKLKARMIAAGKTKVWTVRPACGGRLNASLAGRKNHLRMACETSNCMRMME